MNNEPIIQLAERMINDCNEFEIKDLDAKLDRVEFDDIELCSDYIKSHIKGAEEQQKKHIIETGNEKLDNIGFLEKGRFKLFYTDNTDLEVQRITNNAILDAVSNGKRVLSLSTYLSFVVGQYQSTIMHKLNKDNVEFWFDNKPLYISEYCENDDAMTVICELEQRNDALGIDVLYLPNLECSLINCDSELQLEILCYLSDLAWDKQICIVTTLSPYFNQADNGVFQTIYKINDSVFSSILSMESIHNVELIDDKTVTMDCWDFWDYNVDAPKTVVITSSNGFYTFDNIECFVKGINH